MPNTIAFDVYGTLIDVHGIVQHLEQWIGDDASAFSNRWRDKQLEYSFRRGLMRNYADFASCTHDALEYTCASFDNPLSISQKSTLMEQYKALPAYEDVAASLKKLQVSGHRLYAFSNGQAATVDSLLSFANIRTYFIDIISVETLRTFKPNPDVYEYFLKQTCAEAQQTWLVSSNAFDIIGAHHAGLNTAWIQRDTNNIFDPWGAEPTVTANDLMAFSANLAIKS